MRRFSLFLLTAALALALPAGAQKRPKDEVLNANMERQFSQMADMLTQLSAKVAGLEQELARIKQQNADLGNEMRTLQSSVKDSTGKVNELQLSSERNLLTLSRDVVAIRSDLSNLTDLIKRGQMAAVPSAAPLQETLLEPVGYLTEVTDSEVKIKIDSGKVVSQGMRLGVFPAQDPKTQIGILVVSVVVDANNARADIIRKDPGASFKFSDIVRPIS